MMLDEQEAEQEQFPLPLPNDRKRLYKAFDESVSPYVPEALTTIL